mgnify:FL=1
MSTRWLKRIAAALALCTALTSLTACGGTESSAGTAEGTAEGTAQAAEETEPAAKLGFIYKGSVEAGGFTADCNRQRLAAEQYSDVESEYIDNVPVSEFEKAVKLLVEDGCTHIVAGSPVYANIINSVSKNYMNISFIGYGAGARTVNIYAYTEGVYQAAYVAGMAAAYNSDSEKIGMVVDPSMLYTIPSINAAALGSQIVYTTAQLVTAWASGDSEIRNAVDALAAKGCDVIISYTESPEVVNYCSSKGIKVIGNIDYSSNYADYDSMIMYFYSSRDSFFLSQYKAMQLGEWETSSYMGTLGNGVLCISDALPAAKDGTQDIVNTLVPKVASGSAPIFMGQIKDSNDSIRLREGAVMATSDVLAMDWYVLGVDNSLDSFIESKAVFEEVPLEIKR